MKKRTKGEGTIRKRSDGRWEGRYIDSTGQNRSIYDKSKQKLREHLNDLSYLRNTTQFDNVGGDVALNIYFEHYIEVKRFSIKERSISQITLIYEKHIKPIVGKKIINSLNVNDIISVKRSLQCKNLSEVTQNNIITHFRAMLNFAAKEGILKQNPFLYVHNEKPQPKKIKRDLTDAEIGYILREAKASNRKGDHIYIMLCTLVYTGMRVGELCGLRWNDIDKYFQYVTIDESRTDNKFENTTKTRSSQRVLPLNDFLSKLYRELYAEISPKNTNDYIFITRINTPYHSSLISLRLTYIENQIKEKYNIDLTYISPHYFRHTFATRGIDNGVSIKDMQELLGHADTRTLMDVYMHTNSKKSKIQLILFGIA